MKNFRSPNLDKIVGRHLQMWEIRKDVSLRREREESSGLESLGPYLSVSRLPGSQGEEVARLCAERLGWVLFDREIVDHIARDAKTLGNFVTSLDERCRNAMDDWISTALDTDSMGHLSYLRHLKRVLMTVALHGNAVILGRGANFILPPEAGMRVLVTAPPLRRIRNLAGALELSTRKATRELKRLDEQRREFLKTHFLGAGQELDHYDLIVNVDHMTPEDAATMIVDSFYTLDRRSRAVVKT
jgi:hypothetical protein